MNLDVKLYEEFIKNIDSNNETISTPNFSIVMPGGCNGKCNFCFWKKTKPCNNYLEKLSETLDNLPPQFYQISITGGEPTISPYLEGVLNIIDRKKFTHVVLTTNGAKLLDVVPMLEGKVDHINISRHHYEDSINESVFRTNMPNIYELKEMVSELSKVGIDVTFSAVLSENLNSQKDINKYIKFAKKCGASQVFFRKPHGTLEPTSMEKSYENHKFEDFTCPVCRTRVQLIEGMKVSWKSSLMEPSKELGKVYELIFNENGKLTKDWEAKIEVNDRDLKESYSKINEQCGGGSVSCGGGAPNRNIFDNDDDDDDDFDVETIRRNIRNRGNIPRPAMGQRPPMGPKPDKERELIQNLSDFYVGRTQELNIGDEVVYNKPGAKHHDEKFIYDGDREDGKYKLKKDTLIFYASPENVNMVPKNKDVAAEKLKKILYNMVENGDLKKEKVDKFLKIREIDPFGEENWWDTK